MQRKLRILIAFLMAVPLVHLTGQDWVVPEEDSALKNPVEYNLTNVKKGKELYLANCKSCHGDPGKNNPLPLVPLPPDVTSERMQENSEGAIFYKVTHGRGAMPQFETVLSEDERWKVVNFIMNYNPGRTALIIETPPIKAQIWASVKEEEKSIEVFIESIEKDGSTNNLVDVPVTISSKKTFGNLEIGEVISDKNGRSRFEVPESVIGDEEGVTTIVVSLSDDYDAKPFILENAKVASLKQVTKLIHPGVIWSTNENIPMWLLLSFIAAVLAAWATIGYVIVQIVKIKKFSKE